MPLWTPAEARLLALERKGARILEELRGTQQDLARVGQSLWDAWGDLSRVGGAGVPPGGTCSASYSGVLQACGGGVVGQTITVADQATGTVLGTCTTTGGGNFLGSVTITSPTQVVNVTTAVTGYPATTSTFTFNCGSNSLGTIVLGSGAGVATIILCNNLCLISALPFTDSLYGSGTLTWNGTVWKGCIQGLNYAAYAPGGCAAQTIAITYSLNTSGQLSVSWVQSVLSSCPLNSTCATTPNITKVQTSPATNCAHPATAAFAMGNSIDEQYLRRGAASQTITVTLKTA
jgi:hypothetical protein